MSGTDTGFIDIPNLITRQKKTTLASTNAYEGFKYNLLKEQISEQGLLFIFSDANG